MSPAKEPHFYSTDFPVSTPLSKNAYLDLFAPATSKHKAIGEASVWYLLSKYAVPSIHDEDLNTKYIVMLRNPVEMASSLHWQTVFNGDEDILDFSKAWELQEVRAAGAMLPKHCRAPALVQYRSACSLGSQLQRLYQTVCRQRVRTLFLEDMARNPMAVWNQTLEFLQVPPFHEVDFVIKNPAKHWRFRSVQSLERSYRTLLKRLNIGPLGMGGMRFLKHFSIQQAHRPPLDDNSRKMLGDSFRQDITLLGEITGRDLTNWLSVS